MAKALAARLLELKDEKQFDKWDEVALLFRASTGFPFYEEAFEEAGIPFAMMTDHPVIPIQFLPVQAGIAVREGLSEETALRSITRNAAEIVGIQDRVGTLEAGKDADVAVFDGHPFDYRTHCVLTLINGKVVHNTLKQEA